MDVTKIGFNAFLGIKRSEDENFLLMLEGSENYLNHIGTVHASAQFALAEATSGEYLLKEFPDYAESIIPVVRRVEIKYSKPANGSVFSKAEIPDGAKEKFLKELDGKGRAIVSVSVKITDQSGNTTMLGIFDWFIQKINQGN